MHAIAENVYLEVGSGVPIESENLVEFHLLYSGPLHSGSESQRKEKHAIRKVFHSQLRQLWIIHPNLRERAVGHGGIGLNQEQNAAMPSDDLFQRGVLAIAENWNRNGFNFLPLVTEKLCLRCSLEILFLRRDERNYVLQGGDIDGRIKILFDSLRLPKDKQEFPPNTVPQSDENPFFCLLEDDSLISEVHIKTGPLLMLPGTSVIDKHEVYLEIAVRLNTTRAVAHSWVFE
jgi:hypothetical protein